MKKIPLNNAPGKVAIVDDEFYPLLSLHEWRLGDGGYPIANFEQRIIKLHRLVMPSKNGCVIDHRDRNRLNNTRENLRHVGYAGNAQNRRKVITEKTTSIYKGVHRDKHGKWRVRICANGKEYRSRGFLTEIEAARKYDELAMEMHGHCAALNFPMDLDVPSDSPLFLPEKRVVQSTDDLKVSFPTDKANRGAG